MENNQSCEKTASVSKIKLASEASSIVVVAKLFINQLLLMINFNMD